jgi:hypothetical protein
MKQENGIKKTEFALGVEKTSYLAMRRIVLNAQLILIQ